MPSIGQLYQSHQARREAKRTAKAEKAAQRAQAAQEASAAAWQRTVENIRAEARSVAQERGLSEEEEVAFEVKLLRMVGARVGADTAVVRRDSSGSEDGTSRSGSGSRSGSESGSYRARMGSVGSRQGSGAAMVGLHRLDTVPEGESEESEDEDGPPRYDEVFEAAPRYERDDGGRQGVETGGADDDSDRNQ